MYLFSSSTFQIGDFLIPSRVESVELDSETNLKVFIVRSSPISCPYSSHTFGCNLHLKHYLGEDNSLPNKITKNARSPVTYILSIDT